MGVDLADGRAAAEACRGTGAWVNATGLFDLAATPDALSAPWRTRQSRAPSSAHYAPPSDAHKYTFSKRGGLRRARLDAHARDRAPPPAKRVRAIQAREGEAAALAEHQGDGLGVAVLRPTLVPMGTGGGPNEIAAQARALGVR